VRNFLLLIFITFCAQFLYAQPAFINGSFEPNSGCTKASAGDVSSVGNYISDCVTGFYLFGSGGTAFYSDGTQGMNYGDNYSCFYYSPTPSDGLRSVAIGINAAITMQLTQALVAGQCYTITYDVINSTGDDGSGSPCSSLLPAQLEFGVSNANNIFGTTVGTSSYVTPLLYTWGTNTFTFTAPAGTNNYITIQMADQSNNYTLFFLDNMKIAEVTCPILPVLFGSTQAVVRNNALTVNWETTTENNNDYFQIEISNDGKQFSTIGNVSSKATRGSSTTPLLYSFTISLNNVFLAVIRIPFILLTLIALLFIGKKRWIFLMPAIAFLILIPFISCNKSNSKTMIQKEGKIFVRIAQVDKDGTIKYSKIVQAVNK
jgi:hypothetical protein